MEEGSLYAGDLHPGKNYQRQCLVPVNIASVFFIKQNYGVTLEIVCIKDQQLNLRTQSQHTTTFNRRQTSSYMVKKTLIFWN